MLRAMMLVLISMIKIVFRCCHVMIYSIEIPTNKSAHVLAIRLGYKFDQLAKNYIDEIVKLHSVPVSIVSDRDLRFTSRLWKTLQQAPGTKLISLQHFICKLMDYQKELFRH